jgi:hypothetical protein
MHAPYLSTAIAIRQGMRLTTAQLRRILFQAAFMAYNLFIP